MFDEGREFTAATFQEGLERHGIIPLEVSRQVPFANGVVERRGGMFKEVYYRTKELVQPVSLEEVEDAAWNRAHEIRAAARKALVELDAK
ncbi:unnamed protein product, partial [Symbiodinium necroappetens]